jgi:hypothetical protein
VIQSDCPVSLLPALVPDSDGVRGQTFTARESFSQPDIACRTQMIGVRLTCTHGRRGRDK